MVTKYGSSLCHLLRINSAITPATDFADPWTHLLQKRYSGLNSGLSLARQTLLANAENNEVFLIISIFFINTSNFFNTFGMFEVGKLNLIISFCLRTSQNYYLGLEKPYNNKIYNNKKLLAFINSNLIIGCLNSFIF